VHGDNLPEAGLHCATPGLPVSIRPGMSSSGALTIVQLRIQVLDVAVATD
jgi:hypothetical protein